MAATATTAAAGAWADDGKFTIAGLGTASGADGVLNTGILTPTVSPAWTVDALIGRRIKLDATWYAISDNDATTATITGPPGDATYTYLLGGPPIATDIVAVAHAMTIDGAATARIPPTAGTLASLDLAVAGGASPGLTVTGTVALVCTATIQGIENLDDSGVAAVLTITGSGETTLNERYTCAGTTTWSGTVTGGGPASTSGVVVNGALAALTVTGMSNADSGVYNDGTITGNVTGTSNAGTGVDNLGGTITGDVTGTCGSGWGVINDGGTIVADSITATSTSYIAFIDDGGTLTESTGAAGVNLTVRRLDGGQAIVLDGTTISDELNITYVSNQTTPLVI